MNIHILTLIISLIVVLIPLIYGICLPIFKPHLSQKGAMLLNAFASGFFLIIGILGFLNDSREDLIGISAPQWKTFLIMFSGISISLLVALLLKFLIAHFTTKDKNAELHEIHSHDPMIFNIGDVKANKTKLLAVLLVLAHRIPGGLILGFLVNQVAREGFDTNSIIFLVTFMIHIVPEELIIYYRQIESGINKWKATFNSFLATLLLVPFILIGTYASNAVNNPLLFSFVKACVGGFFIFVALVEFIPEFFHQQMDGKTWYLVILFLLLGIICATAVMSFHVHPHAEDHAHEQQHREQNFLNLSTLNCRVNFAHLN